MRKLAFVALVLLLCCGQQCGAPVGAPPHHGIPEGVYAGEFECEQTTWMAYTDGTGDMQTESVSFRLTRTFNANGSLINDDGQELSPGQPTSVSMGMANMEATVDSVQLGNNYYEVWSWVSMSFAAEPAWSMVLEGYMSESHQFLSPDSVSVVNDTNLLGEAGDGTVIAMQEHCSGTLSR